MSTPNMIKKKKKQLPKGCPQHSPSSITVKAASVGLLDQGCRKTSLNVITPASQWICIFLPLNTPNLKKMVHPQPFIIDVLQHCNHVRFQMAILCIIMYHCISLYIYLCISSLYIFVCIHIYIYIYTYIYIYIYISLSFFATASGQ